MVSTLRLPPASPPCRLFRSGITQLRKRSPRKLRMEGKSKPRSSSVCNEMRDRGRGIYPEKLAEFSTVAGNGSIRSLFFQRTLVRRPEAVEPHQVRWCKELHVGGLFA